MKYTIILCSTMFYHNYIKINEYYWEVLSPTNTRGKPIRSNPFLNVVTWTGHSVFTIDMTGETHRAYTCSGHPGGNIWCFWMKIWVVWIRNENNVWINFALIWKEQTSISDQWYFYLDSNDPDWETSPDVFWQAD